MTIGGPGSGYHVGVMPVTIAQARTRNAEQGAAKLAAYAYQSYDQGRIPPDHDVIGLWAEEGGVVLFEDECVFRQSGTTLRSWGKTGQVPPE